MARYFQHIARATMPTSVTPGAALPVSAGEHDDQSGALAPQVDAVVPYRMRAGPAATLRDAGPGREVAKRAPLVLLCLLFLAHGANASELAGRVVAVADGDTLTLLVSRQQIKVRLLDIDAPERKQPFGTRSRQSLAPGGGFPLRGEHVLTYLRTLGLP